MELKCHSGLNCTFLKPNWDTTLLNVNLKNLHLTVPRLESPIVIDIFSSTYFQQNMFPESLESNFIYSEVV